MTYLAFHGVYTLPVLFILSLWAWIDIRRGLLLAGHDGHSNLWAVRALFIMALIAFIYTTPWDNYLVAEQVWGYGEGRVLFTLGYVPFEEYLFFIVQTLLTGLFLFTLMRYFPKPVFASPNTPRNPTVLNISCALFWLMLSVLGCALLLQDIKQARYFGLITAWACPVLAVQFGYGFDLMLERARVLLPAIIFPTLYLWYADLNAITKHIWWISADNTLGWSVFGLPFEEALFFLLTNCLVACGLTLALHPSSLARYHRLRAQVGWSWRGPLLLWVLAMVPAPLHL